MFQNEGAAVSIGYTDQDVHTNDITKEVYEYTRIGIKIMILNGWMEEPPKMENREELIN
ncbi:MAG: hypothetical protein WCF60_20310 [Anaerobacillus sp.]